MVLLFANHVLAQCDVFISNSTGNAELFVHPTQCPPNKVLAPLNSLEVLPQMDQLTIHLILSILKQLTSFIHSVL